MIAYKVSEYHCNEYEADDHFFFRKKDAIGFIAKRIKEMIAADEYDIYDGAMKKEIDKLLKNKQWEKLAPYFSLFLSKIEIQ